MGSGSSVAVVGKSTAEWALRFPVRWNRTWGVTRGFAEKSLTVDTVSPLLTVASPGRSIELCSKTVTDDELCTCVTPLALVRHSVLSPLWDQRSTTVGSTDAV